MRKHFESNDVSKAFRLDSPPDAITTIGGKSYLYFVGDGYLGLQADPGMIDVACKASLKYGLGTATTRNSFTAAPVQEVEECAASFFQTQSAYYTIDEHSAAELLLYSISNCFERAFVDECSAPFWKSLFQKVYGCVSSDDEQCQKKPIVFKHCNPEDLKRALDANLALGERPLVLTDGVFASFGDIAPLKEYERILKSYGKSLILIDDSHAVGVIGKNFRGSLDYWGFDSSKVNQTGNEISFEDKSSTWSNGRLDTELEREYGNQVVETGDVSIYMFASLAKAVGGFGCIIAGSELFIDEIMENDMCYAIPPNSAAASTAYALNLLTTSCERNKQLVKNIKYIRNALSKIGLETGDNPTPIIPLQIGSVQNMRRIQKELENDRILVSFLPLPYQGSMGVLRLAVFATHTPEIIQMLLDSLKVSIKSRL